MNHIDAFIEAASIEELKALIERIQEAIEQMKVGEIAAIREQMVEMARKVDMAPEDVLSFYSRKRKVGKPKYRNPNNPEQTWTGRGKPPRWLKAMDNPESSRIPD